MNLRLFPDPCGFGRQVQPDRSQHLVSWVPASRLGLLVVVWSLTTSTVTAQAVSLSMAQRARLAELVTTNSEANHLFERIRKEADAALGDPGNPVETVATAGLLESDPAKVSRRASLRDMRKLHALECAFAVTSQDCYREAAKRIILSWARVNRPVGIPIDETKLEPLFVAYDSIRKSLAAPERQVVDQWLRKITEAERTSGERDSVTTSNNWQSHRLKITGLIGFLLDDSTLIRDSIEGFKKQVGLNLRPDGSSFDFFERDSLHYHCYTLEPLLTLAIAAQRHGICLYEYQAANGASLSASVAFLAPYCRGEKTHPEWVHSKVRFDAIRASAGERKFAVGALFDPHDAYRVLELASYFDSHYVAMLSSSSTIQFPMWQTVINEVSR